jgi:hypothetical protein
VPPPTFATGNTETDDEEASFSGAPTPTPPPTRRASPIAIATPTDGAPTLEAVRPPVRAPAGSIAEAPRSSQPPRRRGPLARLSVALGGGGERSLAFTALALVAVVAVGLAAGLLAREWRMRIWVARRHEQARQKLSSGNYPGFQAAELVYRQDPGGAQRCTRTRRARARARADGLRVRRRARRCGERDPRPRGLAVGGG